MMPEPVQDVKPFFEAILQRGPAHPCGHVRSGRREGASPGRPDPPRGSAVASWRLPPNGPANWCTTDLST